MGGIPLHQFWLWIPDVVALLYTVVGLSVGYAALRLAVAIRRTLVPDAQLRSLQQVR